MTKLEITAKAYEIVGKLIDSFLTETASFKIQNDRDVLDAVKELGDHCKVYCETLNEQAKSDKVYILGLNQIDDEEEEPVEFRECDLPDFLKEPLLGEL